MLETQQIPLETIVKDRKLLDDRIKMQHDRWTSDTRLYEDLICQLKGDLVLRDSERLLDLNTSLKQRDGFICQIISDQTNNVLQDFKEYFSLLPSKISDPSFRVFLQEAHCILEKLPVLHLHRCTSGYGTSSLGVEEREKGSGYNITVGKKSIFCTSTSWPWRL